MKNKINHSFVIVLILLVTQVSSQNESAKWHFGVYAGLDFMTNPPSVLTTTTMGSVEGCASIADTSGNFLFFTNGGPNIYNQQEQIMANGSGILGDYSSCQSALIIKQPQSTNNYYLFTMGATAPYGLRYSVIDMSLAAGNGSVTLKNSSLYTGVAGTEKLCGTRHCNGTDYWIVIHEYGSNNFRSYLLTASGISTVAIISSVGTSYNSYGGPGCMKISPSGKKLAAVETSYLNYFMEVYDFDNASGVVSNALHLNVSDSYDCEFSPDASKLYGTQHTGSGDFLLQWDLCAGSGPAIVASQYSIALSVNGLAGMQRASNGKIYLLRSQTNYLAVIHNPNAAASAVSYSELGQFLGAGVCNLGLPNFVGSQIKSTLNYVQDLGCTTVSFSPPPIVYQGTAGCSNVVNIVSSYHWVFGDPSSGAANTSTLSHPLHSFSSLGNYYVRLVLNYANCAPDTIKQVLSINNPSISVLQASVSCSTLNTVTVQVNNGFSASAYSYSWSPSAPTTSVVSLSAGLYTVSVKANGGTCVSSITTAILTPSIVSGVTSSTLFCDSANVAISVINGSGNYTYTWSASSQTNSLVTGLSPGALTITVNDVDNQCAFSQTLTVTTLPSPTLTVVGNYTVCKGNLFTLTVSGADTYTWSNASSSPIYTSTLSNSGTLTVSGTNTMSHCFSKKILTISVQPCTELQNLTGNTDSFDIFPNPTKDVLKVSCDVRASEWSLSIRSALGEEVKYIQVEQGKQEFSINIENLANGIYFVNVFYSDVISETKRLVILH